MPVKTIDPNKEMSREKVKRDMIRTIGAWGHKANSKGADHYYITKNIKSVMAVSLCKQVVVNMDDLVLTDPQVKCMVCALFKDAEKEVRDSQYQRLADAMPE